MPESASTPPTPSSSGAAAVGLPDVAVIGGSGFYTFLDDPTEVSVETPYGDPSEPISVGLVDGRPVAFLPRHGRRHEHPPHRINYRANLWALRSLGVTRVLGPCAVGGLQPALGPGTLLVPDQLVDRTTGRTHTFMDDGAIHVSFADPYCPALRAALCRADHRIVDAGTMVVIDGPRFSTRAESQWHAAQGWSVVSMTGCPEAVLARELAMCYATIALVTDRDAGIAAGEEVHQQDVFATFADNIDRLRTLLTAVISTLPARRGSAASTGKPGDEAPAAGADSQSDDAEASLPTCHCAEVLDGLPVPFELPGPQPPPAANA